MLTSSEMLQGAGLATIIVYQFVGISILCDEHLCPVLERLCTKFRLPTAMAGATLLAFGSSAPEIIIGACGAASDRTELSIPTILVSALIAFGVIPPMVVATVGSITLDGAGVFRDAVAYGLSVGLLLYFDERKEIGAYRAGILTVCYFVYLLFIYWTSPDAHQEAERARENLCAVLEEGSGEKGFHHSGEHRFSGGSRGSSNGGRRVSTWLAALSEQDVETLQGESLSEPLMKTAAPKDGRPRGSNGKISTCTPVSEGSSPTQSTCATPSINAASAEPVEQDRFTGVNGHAMGKCYEVASLVTMRASEDLLSEIKGELPEGTMVRILETGKGRRAKVAAGQLEGWVSLTTARGEVLVGKNEVVEAKVCPKVLDANPPPPAQAKAFPEALDANAEPCHENISERGSEDSEEESNAPTTFSGRLFALLCRPFEIIFERLIPSDPSAAFAVCLVLLALLSEGALYAAGVLADVWHISGATAGMTLLAFGGQIPDAIAAVELARSGMPDAAVAQAVASQVINITLGVGLPFFVYTLVTGLPTYNNHPKQIFTVASSLGVVILAYLVTLAVGATSGGKVTITKFRAVVLTVAFGTCYIYALVAVEMGW